MDKHISVEKAYEVRHWTRQFACTKDQLLEAVKEVGTREEDVREHIRTTFPLSSRWREFE